MNDVGATISLTGGLYVAGTVSMGDGPVTVVYRTP